MIIAQYSVRSKQEYIFRTNRILDIVGASTNITNAWDVLVDEAKRAGLNCILIKDEEFIFKSVKERFENGSLNMVELFRGGGNYTVLYDSMSSYIKANTYFSYKMRTAFPGMITMAVCVEVSGDYSEDYRNLMAESERKKNIMIPGKDDHIVPFTMTDRYSFQPFTDIYRVGDKVERITAETKSKRYVGKQISDRDKDVKKLDDLVTKRNEESLLAIVHADGNNMGKKIQGMLKNCSDYDTGVKTMRDFTTVTGDRFVSRGIKAMEECQADLKKRFGKKYHDSAYLFRLIVADGDDFTFICRETTT